MRVVVSPKAAQDIEAQAIWWRANRPAAPTMFRDEIREVLRVLAVTPYLGVEARDVAARGVRRVYLRGSRNFVYYSVQAETVEVLRVWHSSRGSTPTVR